MSFSTFRARVEQFTEDDLIRIWARTFDIGGEHHSRIVRDQGAVAEIARRVRDSSPDTPPSLIVARAVHDIIAWHPFMDCNHRTAASVAALFMGAAGARRLYDGAGWVAFLRSVDRDGLSVTDVQAGIRRFFTR